MEEKSNLRETGLDVIGAVPWGTHFCQFYETKQDLLDVLVPYFKEGLENNELCVWVTSEFLNTIEATAAMKTAIPSFSKYFKKGQIEIFPHTVWYLKGGQFEMKRVLADWVRKHDQALTKGFSGTRVSGNPFWIDNKKDWNDFATYEAEINKVIDKYKLVVLCTYSSKKCGFSEVIDVVQNHEFALIKQRGKWKNIESAGHNKMEAALRQSEARFRSYIEMTDQLGWTTNAKGEVEEDLPVWRKYTGQSFEEVKGTRWSKAVHPNDVKRVAKVWKKAVSGKIPYEIEYRIRRHDGVYRHFLVRGVPVFGMDGNIREWVGTCIDISGRKKAEEELVEHALQLEGLNKAKDEFVSFASHELRSPLSTIAWSIEEISEDKRGFSTEQNKSLERIYNQTQRVIKLTNDLLDATKMELGVFPYKYEEVNPLDIASDVIIDLNSQIRNKKINFKSDFGSNIKKYKTYSNAIYLILRNLLSNAVRFTPPGGRVSLKISKTEKELILQVSDSGLGIPKSAQEKIFQKMYRAKNVKNKFEGSGLGLYIVSAIISQMNGKITVESKLRKGATFIVTLPEQIVGD